MKPHELCLLFPPISDIFDLVADIRDNGLIDPITTYEGKILDGRNRFAACTNAQVEPRFVEYEGDDPLAFVISKNLNRRHLSESQRAMVAARIADMKLGDNQHKKQDASIEAPTSQLDAAKKMKVARSTVQRAASVLKTGVPELVEAVDNGDIAVSVAASIAKEPKARQREIVDSPNPKVEAKRSARRTKLDSITTKAPVGEYSVIYADPPWQWDTYSDKGKEKTPENHYPLMDTDDICDLPIPAAKDSVCFVWATAPRLPDALRVMEAWGFEYKSHVVWVKERVGTGYWFRNTHELLLVGTRGKIPAPAMGDQVSSTVVCPVAAHSEKPEKFREIIESYYPNVARIEMFRRGAAPDGWVAWGNETVEKETGT